MTKQQIAVGIDIGGTNTLFGLVTADGKILFQKSLSTLELETPEQLVSVVSAEIKKAISENNLELMGVGIGAPNGNFYRGTIEFAPNLKWFGIIPMAQYFKESLQTNHSYLTNDANAAAIGEMIFGAARGMKDFIIITLGTGLGSGIVANGELVYGHDGFAGELGHTIYDYNGRQCGCGRKGCLETYCSATGIVKTVNEWLATTDEESVLRNEQNISSKTIYEAALQNDALAIKAFDFTAEILGKKLADAVAFSSPEAIILFGGLANAGDLLFIPTKKYMEENLLHIYKSKVKLLPSELNENDAAILGAASLVWKEI